MSDPTSQNITPVGSAAAPSHSPRYADRSSAHVAGKRAREDEQEDEEHEEHDTDQTTTPTEKPPSPKRFKATPTVAQGARKWLQGQSKLTFEDVNGEAATSTGSAPESNTPSAQGAPASQSVPATTGEGSGRDDVIYENQVAEEQARGGEHSDNNTSGQDNAEQAPAVTTNPSADNVPTQTSASATPAAVPSQDASEAQQAEHTGDAAPAQDPSWSWSKAEDMASFFAKMAKQGADQQAELVRVQQAELVRVQQTAKDDVEKMKAEMQTIIEEKQKLVEEKAAVDEEKKKLKRENERLAEEKAALRREVSKSTANERKIQEPQAQLQQKQREHKNNIEREKQGFHNMVVLKDNEHRDMVKRENDRYEAMVEEKDKEHQDLVARLDDTEAQVKVQKKAKVAVEGEKRKLKRDNEKLKGEKKKLNDDNKKLEKEVRELYGQLIADKGTPATVMGADEFIRDGIHKANSESEEAWNREGSHGKVVRWLNPNPSYIRPDGQPYPDELVVKMLKIGDLLTQHQLESGVMPISTALHFQKHADAFRAEAHTLRNLKHPHIVELFYYEEGGPGEVKGYRSMLLEEVDNDVNNLAFWQANDYRGGKTKELPFRGLQGLQFLSQVSDALRYLESKQLVHRDLKPENIGYIEEGDSTGYTFKILDFGTCVPTGTSNNDGMGTVLYRAPEQRGEDETGEDETGGDETAYVQKAHPGSDMYSLFVTLEDVSRCGLEKLGDSPQEEKDHGFAIQKLACDHKLADWRGMGALKVEDRPSAAIILDRINIIRRLPAGFHVLCPKSRKRRNEKLTELFLAMSADEQESFERDHGVLFEQIKSLVDEKRENLAQKDKPRTLRGGVKRKAAESVGKAETGNKPEAALKKAVKRARRG